MRPLRLIYMGTPDFSVRPLEALIEAGHEVIAVYTQPPRPAGRGQQERKSAVHIAAEEMNLTVRTPKTLRDPEELRHIRTLDPDAIVVAAYGLILPKDILDAPPFGCLNIHASLLPRWRGAAPIQRALLAGDEETGVTIMQMDEGVDTGGMLLSDSVAITRESNAQTIHDALSEIGARLIVETLLLLEDGRIAPVEQDESKATMAPKITRDDGRIDWAAPAIEIERRIRALTPWPGTWFEHQGERFRVGQAEAKTARAEEAPGTVLDKSLTVACGEGAIRILRIQRAGKAEMDARAFLRGFYIAPGTQLGAQS